MSIHTAQHLLSAVLDVFDLNTLSWGMPAYPSLDPPYIELPRALTWEEAQAAEARCNELIKEDRKVWIDVTVQGETRLQVDSVKDAEGIDVERESRGIPKDYTGVSV
jgi:Ser-tRNA(Ala) deacylase AlaX